MMATCNLGHWVVDKLAKLSKIYSLWNVLQLIFCEILPKATKFGFRVVDWVLAIKFKHFRDFLEF